MSYKATDHDVDQKHVDFCDRVDSGFDSGLPSYRDDEDFHSGNLPSTDDISSKVKVPGSVDNSPRVEPKEIEIQDECFDSGYKSTTPLDPKENPGYQTCKLPQNVDVLNYSGFAPIHLAAQSNRANVVRRLVRVLKCNINIGDLKSGRTALHHAIECRSTEAMKMLLKYGIHTNTPTYDDCTALHLAVAKGMPLVVSTLLNHKADLFSSTHDNQDVFDLAVRNPQMLRHLKSAFKLKH
uniref:Uncharacterized protein n=1 Tax=Ciona savignyi TaxID=51511 RepID=H2ZCH4_CIOSA